MNELNSNRKLIRHDWFSIHSPETNHFPDESILSKAINQPNIEEFRSIYTAKNQLIDNFLLDYKDTLYWVNYDSIKLSDGQNMYYGSTINLFDLYNFLRQLMQRRPIICMFSIKMEFVLRILMKNLLGKMFSILQIFSQTIR
ncbi:hypothetical protein [Empedobacter sp.]|uniref:hypothetical protein n=1 Tax=Empedobacter sp. TaxID=1927715 RepID=UPI0028A079A9|nr:hypothetical protein [Empedobacter sp.]